MLRISLISLLLSITFLFFSCGDKACIDGDGIASTISNTLSSFDKIDNDGTVDVRIAYGTDYSYVLTGDSNIISEIDVLSNNQTLTIDIKKDCINTTQSIVLEVFVPMLSEIINEGTGDVIGTTNFENLTIDNQGTGNIDLTGNVVNTIDVINEGTGDIKLYGLETNTMTISSSGTGDAFVNVIEKLTATLTGTGDISYKGTPEIVSDITGTGKLIDAN